MIETPSTERASLTDLAIERAEEYRTMLWSLAAFGFFVLSFAGGLIFSIPAFLLLHIRKRSGGRGRLDGWTVTVRRDILKD